MNKTLSCMIIFFELHQTVWGVPPASVMNKILRCVNIFFELHQTVWGVPPASSHEQNIKMREHFFSNYIKLFEVCHPPVLMNKTLSCCMIIFFELHQHVWGVPPASSDEQNIKLREHFFSHYIKLFEVCHPPVLMNKILSCVNIFFRITSNCLRCATRQFWWTKH